MAEENEEKERLSDAEFAELIPHLPLQDLLLIEFKIDVWKSLIFVKDTTKKLYGCGLCGVVQNGTKNLYAHIDGKKHKLRTVAVKKLYHPEYTYGKENPKIVQAAKKLPTPSTTSVPKKTQKNERPNLQVIPTVKGTFNNPKIAKMDKANNANKILQRTENAVKDSLDINEQSKKQNDTQLPSDNSNNSNATDNAVFKDLEAAKNLKKKDEHETISGDIASSTECSAANSTYKPLKEADTEDLNSSEEVDKCNEVSDEQSEQVSTDAPLSKMVKNPFAFLSKPESNVSDKNKTSTISCTDVIIIDDDVGLNEKSNDNDPKRKVSDEDTQPNTKKQRVVVNPIETLETTEKKDTPSTTGIMDSVIAEKPRYQSNIVIVPTINKSNSALNSQKNVKNQPKFSVKTFSSNLKDIETIGLIGVEYVIKIMKSRNDLHVRYECGLCELVTDGSGMQDHLTGYEHRLKFCEKHFPTAVRQYRQYIGKLSESETRRVLTPILEKLAIAIEQYHGRDLPYECLERDLSINRHEILTKVFSCRHASEQYGPGFTHVVDSKEVDKLIQSCQNYKEKEITKPVVCTFNRNSVPLRRNIIPRPYVPAFNPPPYCGPPNYMMHNYNQPPMPMPNYPITNMNYAPIDDETHKLMVEDFLRGTRRNLRPNPERSSAYHTASRSRSRSPRLRTKNKYDHNEHVRKSLSPLRQDDIWQAYRHMVDQKITELDKDFKTYRKDPEKHPLYNDEWQAFWKRRKEELINAGLNHRTHNYQPEWVCYFNGRIEELYKETLENIKVESRERLCLPMTNDYLVDSTYHVRESQKPANPSKLEETETKESTGIVPVLRLMIALEEHLGSLGPKIIDLLSKALQAEKTNPKMVDRIVLTPENCTLLETAKEKFKGLIIAGLLDGAKERALKKAIEGVESLLTNPPIPERVEARQSSNPTAPHDNVPEYWNPYQRVSELQPAKKQTEVAQPPVVQTKVTSSILAQSDKKELAAKLASALTAQGKTDIDPQQLQQILTVYMLIEKKKREANSGSGSEQASNIPNQTALTDTLANLMQLSSENKQKAQNDQNRSSFVERRQAPMSTNNSHNFGSMHTNVNYNANQFNPAHISNFNTNASGTYVNNASSFTNRSNNNVTTNTPVVDQSRGNTDIPRTQQLFQGGGPNMMAGNPYHNMNFDWRTFGNRSNNGR